MHQLNPSVHTSSCRSRSNGIFSGSVTLEYPSGQVDDAPSSSGDGAGPAASRVEESALIGLSRREQAGKSVSATISTVHGQELHIVPTMLLAASGHVLRRVCALRADRDSIDGEEDARRRVSSPA